MFRNCSEINIMNITSTTYYSNMFSNTLTDPDAYVIIGYTTETQSIAEAMKSTAGSSSSKITLKQI
ncbi:unknown [Firmicutes bacterium CAG:884]|nr:unknown [Firmicutes bacterium CAG:884]